MRPWIVVAVAVTAVLIAAGLVIRHYTAPDYIEKRLSAAIGPGYLIDIGASHYSPFRRGFHLLDVSIVSDTLRAKPKRQIHPETHMNLKAPSIRANGFNLMALMKGGLDVDGIELDRPKLTLYVDRYGMPLEHERPAVRMPHEAIYASSRRIQVDAIRVVDGNIAYSERSRDGTRPGIFRFADLHATIENLTNDGDHHDRPCVIDARTRLADSGPLQARFNYYLASGPLRMDYNAVIGPMEASALNDLLVDLKGIRINRGTIDKTTLDIKIDGDVATGTMELLYHGLKFEIIDKDSHKQGAGDQFATWMQNWKTNSSNPDDDGDPATVITLQRRREPHVSLVKFVWETAREGVLRTLGVQ